MNFSDALNAVKAGKKITRTGWNGKGMFVFMVNGSNFKVSRPPLLGIFNEGTDIEYRPHLDMRYADGSVGVWLASHGDMFGDDWLVLSKSDDMPDIEATQTFTDADALAQLNS